ncbi:MAG: hypothetical protein WD708_12770 [Kiritimatiellia bacterium]
MNDPKEEAIKLWKINKYLCTDEVISHALTFSDDEIFIKSFLLQYFKIQENINKFDLDMNRIWSEEKGY